MSSNSFKSVLSGSQKIIASTEPAVFGDGSLSVEGSATISGLNYPTNDGTAGQVIATDGVGNLAFVNPDSATSQIDNLNIYISQTGNDTTGDGTFSMPYQTIERALVDVREIGWNLTAEIRIISTAPTPFNFPSQIQIDVGFKGRQITPLVIRGWNNNISNRGWDTNNTDTVQSFTQDPACGQLTITGNIGSYNTSDRLQWIRFTSGTLANVSFFGAPNQLSVPVSRFPSSNQVQIPYADVQNNGDIPNIGDDYVIESIATEVLIPPFSFIAFSGKTVAFDNLRIRGQTGGSFMPLVGKNILIMNGIEIVDVQLQPFVSILSGIINFTPFGPQTNTRAFHFRSDTANSALSSPNDTYIELGSTVLTNGAGLFLNASMSHLYLENSFISFSTGTSDLDSLWMVDNSNLQIENAYLRLGPFRGENITGSAIRLNYASDLDALSSSNPNITGSILTGNNTTNTAINIDKANYKQIGSLTINSFGIGINVDGTFSCNELNLNDTNFSAIFALNGADININGNLNLVNIGGDSIVIRENSILTANSITSTTISGGIINSNGSYIQCDNITANNNTITSGSLTLLFLENNSFISISSDLTFNNNTGLTDVVLIRNSRMRNTGDIQINNNTNAVGLNIRDGSYLIANTITAQNNNTGFLINNSVAVFSGSVIDLDGNTNALIFVEDNSSLDATNATLIASSGSRGLNIGSNSQADLNAISVSNLTDTGIDISANSKLICENIDISQCNQGVALNRNAELIVINDLSSNQNTFSNVSLESNSFLRVFGVFGGNNSINGFGLDLFDASKAIINEIQTNGNSRSGIQLLDNSELKTSVITATGNTENGVSLSNLARLNITGATPSDLSNNTGSGANIQRSCIFNTGIGSSINFNNNGSWGLFATESCQVNLGTTVASGNINDGIILNAFSTLVAGEITCDNNQGDGIDIKVGSKLRATSLLTISQDNTEYGLRMETGSKGVLEGSLGSFSMTGTLGDIFLGTVGIVSYADVFSNNPAFTNDYTNNPTQNCELTSI